MASSVILDHGTPANLAGFLSLASDSDAKRKVLIDTIRDYAALFDQAVILSGNDGSNDKGTLITKYPDGQLRGYNEGWTSETATGSMVRYHSSMIRTRSVVDKSLIETRPAAERATFRLRQDQAFMRGLARKAAWRIFNADPADDPRDMQGLANLVNKNNEVFAGRVIDAGGTTADKQTSIWIINWAPDAAYLFYPQGGEGPGLQMDDMGVQYVNDADGKPYLAYVTEFAWDLGVAVYDPLKIVRIANIDTTMLSKSPDTDGSPNLIDLLVQGIEMLSDDTSGTTAIYVNETIRSVLRRQIENKSNVYLTWGEVAGRKVVTYDGIPVHRLYSDVLSNTEAVL